VKGVETHKGRIVIWFPQAGIGRWLHLSLLQNSGTRIQDFFPGASTFPGRETDVR
jgi:hypothetical protein